MTSNLVDLREVSKKYQTKLEKIKLCLFDIDGILTDGRIYWDGKENGFNRFFHAHDGYGMKILMEAGIKVGVITGGDSVGIQKRFKQLGIDYFFMGNEDKRSALDSILKETGITQEETLYIGDEFFDLPLLKQVGFSATVPNASVEIREAVDYVTVKESGQGCGREVIDMVRHAQGITPRIEY